METRSQRSETIIDLHQVVNTYETPSGPFTALQDVNLRIQAGAYLDFSVLGCYTMTALRNLRNAVCVMQS